MAQFRVGRELTAVTEDDGFYGLCIPSSGGKRFCLLEPQPAQPEDCALASWFGWTVVELAVSSKWIAKMMSFA